MKVYMLPVPDALRPAGQPFRYPAHNKDYGVEQDFLRYMWARKDLTIDDASAADWHYLPVYWTRWHLSHDYGRCGIDELRHAIGGTLQREDRTFTICQYDDGPLVDLGRTILFLASRKSEKGIDIPLLSTPHRRPFWPPRKRYLASFIGRLATHPVRQRMADALANRTDIKVVDGDHGSRAFVRTTLESLAALAPRGYGGNSFRFFEAMQLGVMPILIGAHDTRPFKSFINWDEFSAYVQNPGDLPNLLDSLSPTTLAEKGLKAAAAYRSDIAFGKWCRFVIDELQARA